MAATKGKKHRKVASKTRQRYPMKQRPILTEEAEAEFFEHEEEMGVYAEFWNNLGYYLDKGVDYPPYTGAALDHNRPNNRVRGWNGVFAFTFYWKEAATAEVKANFTRNLAQAYGVTLEESGGSEPSEINVRLTGKKVKALTRLLNRQYALGYLVWKEL